MCPKCGMTTKCGKIFQGKKCLRSFTGKNQHGVKICCTYMASVYTSKKTNCTWHKWLTMTMKYCLQTRYWFTILLLNVVITAVHFLQGKIWNKTKKISDYVIIFTTTRFGWFEFESRHVTLSCFSLLTLWCSLFGNHICGLHGQKWPDT